MQIKSKPCYFLALTLAPYRTEYTIFLFVFLFGWVVVVVLLWFFFFKEEQEGKTQIQTINAPPIPSHGREVKPCFFITWC